MGPTKCLTHESYSSTKGHVTRSHILWNSLVHHHGPLSTETLNTEHRAQITLSSTVRSIKCTVYIANVANGKHNKHIIIKCVSKYVATSYNVTDWYVQWNAIVHFYMVPDELKPFRMIVRRLYICSFLFPSLFVVDTFIELGRQDLNLSLGIGFGLSLALLLFILLFYYILFTSIISLSGITVSLYRCIAHLFNLNVHRALPMKHGLYKYFLQHFFLFSLLFIVMLLKKNGWMGTSVKKRSIVSVHHKNKTISMFYSLIS